MIPSPPISTRNDTLLPYTTHFRSVSVGRGASIWGLSTAWLEWLVLGAGHELMLFASVGILLIGLDDLLFDALWLATRRRDPAPIPSAPPIDGRFAVFVPAWDEAEVLPAMLHRTLWALQEVGIGSGRVSGG